MNAFTNGESGTCPFHTRIEVNSSGGSKGRNFISGISISDWMPGAPHESLVWSGCNYICWGPPARGADPCRVCLDGGGPEYCCCRPCTNQMSLAGATAESYACAATIPERCGARHNRWKFAQPTPFEAINRPSSARPAVPFPPHDGATNGPQPWDECCDCYAWIGRHWADGLMFTMLPLVIAYTDFGRP